MSRVTITRNTSRITEADEITLKPQYTGETGRADTLFQSFSMRVKDNQDQYNAQQ